MENNNLTNENMTNDFRNVSVTGTFKNPFHDTVAKVCFITVYAVVFGTCIIGKRFNFVFCRISALACIEITPLHLQKGIIEKVLA